MRSEVKHRNLFENPFFIGTVIDNNDPNFSYRVKVRIEILHDTLEDADLPWAAKVDSSFMGVGDTDTLHSVPEVGTKVLLLAIGNDPNSLIYLGNLYTKANVTPTNEDYLNCYGIYTKDGDFIKVDKIKKLIELVWRGTINIDKVTDMTITVNGPITVNSQNVTVKNAQAVNVETNSATVKAQSTTLTCPNNTIKGNVTMTGNLTITGNINVTGSVTASVEVTANAVNMTTHTHGGVFPGPGSTLTGTG